MQITGEMLIGAAAVRGSEGTMRAYAPAQGVELEPTFGAGGAADVDRACRLANAAFDPFRQAPLETRARFLEAIAERIVGLGDPLIERAHADRRCPSRGSKASARARSVSSGSSRRSCATAAG
ncbi:aldehyde dehydrogenase family protein [Burkholderia pseudomallei MSHR3016]|nr:aldehyde dehydrogenase family protein [Burkholderia pseudomallei MSHR3016]